MSSTEPTTVIYPIPTSDLSVAGDPNVWGLSENALVAAQRLAAGAPVELDVVRPVAGKLLLAPRRVGAIVLTPLPAPGGWVPCDTLPSAYLYLPSPAGVNPASPGYVLAGSDTNVEALQQAIMTAMSDGTMLNVSITINGAASIVAINGGELPFVVLAKAVPQDELKQPKGS